MVLEIIVNSVIMNLIGRFNLLMVIFDLLLSGIEVVCLNSGVIWIGILELIRMGLVFGFLVGIESVFR